MQPLSQSFCRQIKSSSPHSNPLQLQTVRVSTLRQNIRTQVLSLQTRGSLVQQPNDLASVKNGLKIEKWSLICVFQIWIFCTKIQFMSCSKMHHVTVQNLLVGYLGVNRRRRRKRPEMITPFQRQTVHVLAYLTQNMSLMFPFEAKHTYLLRPPVLQLTTGPPPLPPQKALKTWLTGHNFPSSYIFWHVVLIKVHHSFLWLGTNVFKKLEKLGGLATSPVWYFEATK